MQKKREYCERAAREILKTWTEFRLYPNIGLKKVKKIEYNFLDKDCSKKMPIVLTQNFIEICMHLNQDMLK